MTAHPPIPADLARSWILVPPMHRPQLEAAHASGADVVVYDLEDGTEADNKKTARAIVAERLPQQPGWVRVNPADTPFWVEDLARLRNCDGLAGVVLAETVSAAEIDRTAAALDHRVPVIPLIESAAGLEAIAQIVRARATLRVAFGVNDFRRDTGIGGGALALAYVRSQLVLASHAAGIAAPIDGPAPAEAAGDDLAAAVTLTGEMGMTGKLAVHAEQVAAINTHLSPDAHDVAAAKELIARLGEGGHNITDGSDLPRLARAKTLLEHAHRFGVDGA